jgi:antitoxin MazE
VPQAIVGKWGKNLAVRLPGQIAKAAGLTNGEHVEIQARDGDIVIRRPIPRFTLDELFRGKSARQWRRIYAAAFDWGSDAGREVVEE